MNPAANLIKNPHAAAVIGRIVPIYDQAIHKFQGWMGQVIAGHGWHEAATGQAPQWMAIWHAVAMVGVK